MKKWSGDFTIDSDVTPEHIDYFQKNGVIVFRKFLHPPAVDRCISEISRIEEQWLKEKRDKVNGIPLKFGKDENEHTTIQRFCFMSLFSTYFHEVLLDPRLDALTKLLQPYDGRIGENEKDGLVINSYVNAKNSSFSQMGWHTDSPRDLFMGQKIMPMLNVGIHLDTCLFENGGLRVIPGTHKQGMLGLLFRKKYFIDHSEDAREVGFDIFAGDLTVHDGRIWHRVRKSALEGEASRRRVMYIPIITGKYNPKHEKSKTPLYHYFARKVQN
jgi:phytanoyl-CoA hydroxylase